jgi:hypothetical protein
MPINNLLQLDLIQVGGSSDNLILLANSSSGGRGGNQPGKRGASGGGLGIPIIYSPTRTKFSAAALNRWGSCVFSRPTYLDLGTPQVLTAREIVPSMPARLA